MEKVLVSGATGTTGNYIIDILAASPDYEPVAMIRKQEQKEEFERKQVRTVLADLTEDLGSAVKGIDRVIFAAGSKGKALEEVDKNGAKKLVDAAQEAGVTKFVMLSSMGAENPEEADELQEYLQAKHEADEHLKSSRLSYTIVRPGALTDDPGTGKLKKATQLGESGEISREDVARTLVAVLPSDKETGNVFEIIGGDTPIAEAVK